MSLYPPCHLKKRKNPVPTCPVPLPNKEPRRDQEHWNGGWGALKKSTLPRREQGSSQGQRADSIRARI